VGHFIRLSPAPPQDFRVSRYPEGVLLASLTLLPGLLAPPCQDGAQTLAEIRSDLLARTKVRREAAQRTWEEVGMPWARSTEEKIPGPLISLAPEIQEPALKSLRILLENPAKNRSTLQKLLILFGETVNSAGADHISRLYTDIPEDLRHATFRLCVQRGAHESIQATEAYLHAKNPETAEAALQALLHSGPPQKITFWLQQVRPSILKGQFSRSALIWIASRDLPDGFRLPDAFYLFLHPFDIAPHLQILLQAPREDKEDWVIERFMDLSLVFDQRVSALAVAEHGVSTLKWRQAERKMSALLRSKDSDLLAEKTAWTLHRLGAKEGKKWILSAPKENAKENPRDWRVLLSLARTEVDVGEFKDAYRTFKDTIDLANEKRGRLQSKDWVWAARAAVGSKKPREGGAWLAKARMSPSELSPYQDLPEFKKYLEEQPFKRLFGRR